jgi:hypothetical protein
VGEAGAACAEAIGTSVNAAAPATASMPTRREIRRVVIVSSEVEGIDGHIMWVTEFRR